MDCEHENLTWRIIAQKTYFINIKNSLEYVCVQNCTGITGTTTINYLKNTVTTL